MRHGLLGGLALAAALAVAAPRLEAARVSVKVIVNKEQPDARLTADDLERIYLGKKTLWENGQRIAPAMLEETSPVSEEFMQGVLHKSSAQFRAFWKRQLFSGGGAPPRTFRTSAQVAEFVARQPGAIGLVEPGYTDDHVKVLQISE